MASPKAAWGIEIGSYALKAVRLERVNGSVTVSDFSVIPHKKVLTTPDLDQDEIVRISLGQFISQKSLEGEHLVMSVPGHAAFARFAKLPPVEPKKVPDIVKFEAVQQIPFPIDEVEWDYQTFTSDDSPEVEVGIFAITRERVQQRLARYAELGISPEALTLSPVAVYNAMVYDHNLLNSEKPVIFLDIGTQATDVVIARGGRCWIRTFPLGGTHFTEAIASAFKLSYSKAEKLKKEASTSKYAKQIMQAMRPVFSDLLQDLQRSIGYYQSLHKDHELEQMVGIGSTFKIPGLRKFIGQQLQINVVRLDEYKKISVAGREAASFAENAVNMATAYGLALQGVDLAPIAVNLVPVKALREQMWHAKTKWFAAAAVIIVAGAAVMLYHPLTDRTKLEAQPPPEATLAISRAETLKDEYNEARASVQVGATAANMVQLTDYRTVWPHLMHDVATSLRAADPQPELLAPDIESVRSVPPAERRLVKLLTLDGQYYTAAASGAAAPQPRGAAEGASTAPGRRIAVQMFVELSHQDPERFLNGTVAKWLRDNAQPVGERAGAPYRIIPDSVSLNPTQRQEISVTTDGSEQVKSSGGGVGDRDRRSGGSGYTPPSSGRRDRQPSRPPPGPGAGGGVPSGPAGAAGGSGPGRREAPSRRQAPGPGDAAGAGESGGSPGMAPPGPVGPQFGRPQSPLPPVGADTARHAELGELAPIAEPETVYPPGTTYYRLPITFEIEIIDPAARQPAPIEERTRKADGEEAGA